MAGLPAIERLPFVEGSLSYLAPMAEKPRHYTFRPPPGVPGGKPTYEKHLAPIRDLRPIAGSLSLDREGFRLVDHESAVGDFYDEDELRRTAYGEVERLVAAETGAVRVTVFDHTLRRRIPGTPDRSAGKPRQPATLIHVDYSEKSGPQRLADVLPRESIEFRTFAFFPA